MSRNLAVSDIDPIGAQNVIASIEKYAEQVDNLTENTEAIQDAKATIARYLQKVEQIKTEALARDAAKTAEAKQKQIDATKKEAKDLQTQAKSALQDAEAKFSKLSNQTAVLEMQACADKLKEFQQIGIKCLQAVTKLSEQNKGLDFFKEHDAIAECVDKIEALLSEAQTNLKKLQSELDAEFTDIKTDCEAIANRNVWITLDKIKKLETRTKKLVAQRSVEAPELRMLLDQCEEKLAVQTHEIKLISDVQESIAAKIKGYQILLEKARTYRSIFEDVQTVVDASKPLVYYDQRVHEFKMKLETAESQGKTLLADTLLTQIQSDSIESKEKLDFAMAFYKKNYIDVGKEKEATKSIQTTCEQAGDDMLTAYNDYLQDMKLSGFSYDAVNGAIAKLRETPKIERQTQLKKIDEIISRIKKILKPLPRLVIQGLLQDLKQKRTAALEYAKSSAEQKEKEARAQKSIALQEKKAAHEAETARKMAADAANQAAAAATAAAAEAAAAAAAKKTKKDQETKAKKDNELCTYMIKTLQIHAKNINTLQKGHAGLIDDIDFLNECYENSTHNKCSAVYADAQQQVESLLTAWQEGHNASKSITACWNEMRQYAAKDDPTLFVELTTVLLKERAATVLQEKETHWHNKAESTGITQRFTLLQDFNNRLDLNVDKPLTTKGKELKAKYSWILSETTVTPHNETSLSRNYKDEREKLQELVLKFGKLRTEFVNAVEEIYKDMQTYEKNSKKTVTLPAPEKKSAQPAALESLSETFEDDDATTSTYAELFLADINDFDTAFAKQNVDTLTPHVLNVARMLDSVESVWPGFYIKIEAICNDATSKLEATIHELPPSYNRKIERFKEEITNMAQLLKHAKTCTKNFNDAKDQFFDKAFYDTIFKANSPEESKKKCYFMQSSFANKERAFYSHVDSCLLPNDQDNNTEVSKKWNEFLKPSQTYSDLYDLQCPYKSFLGLRCEYAETVAEFVIAGLARNSKQVIDSGNWYVEENKADQAKQQADQAKRQAEAEAKRKAKEEEEAEAKRKAKEEEEEAEAKAKEAPKGGGWFSWLGV